MSYRDDSRDRYSRRSRSPPRRRSRSRSPRSHRDDRYERSRRDYDDDDRSKRRKLDTDDRYARREREVDERITSSRESRVQMQEIHEKTRDHYSSLKEKEFTERPPMLNPDPDFPPLYSIHRGKISGIREFGVFVDILGFKKQGLVHMSQTSIYRIERPEDLKEMFSQGDDVWVKVLSVDAETGKYSLSIKYVNQRDGSDLDPLNEKAKRDNERKNRPPGERGRDDNDRKIQLEYKYDVVCSKCGGMGHLATECFSAIAPKGENLDQTSASAARGYAMVPDNPMEDQWYDVIEQKRQAEMMKQLKKEDKLKRKEERARKRKERKEKKKEKRQRKKEKKSKSKKRRRRSSSSSSSSGSYSSSSESESESADSESSSRGK